MPVTRPRDDASGGKPWFLVTLRYAFFEMSEEFCVSYFVRCRRRRMLFLPHPLL